MLSTLQSGIQLVLGLVADTCFVLASKPPYTANASEIEKDNQPIINRSLSSVHLFSSIVVYGLAVAQRGSEWSISGKILGDHVWGKVEWAGIGAMIFGGLLRLWCYRTLGQFFTFNVSLS
jgi:protein-S-isoprenylcysteine O-methyltransferase Ste14